MKGTIKWFSLEKGYGFITDDKCIDHYFSVRDVVGSELPSMGDKVHFEPAKGKKGPAAKSINILIKNPIARTKPGQVICPHCATAVFPRLITDRGSALHSLCPLCGKMIKNFETIWSRLPKVLRIFGIG